MEIIFGEGKAPLSYLIKWATGFKYSHSALKYPDEEWMIHSTIGGVQPAWWTIFSPKYKSIERFRCKFNHATKAADMLVPSIGGKGYGYWTLIGMGINIIAKRLGCPAHKNIFGDKSTFVCTEVLVEFFKKVKELNQHIYIPDFDPEIMKVDDVYNFIIKRPDLFERIDDGK